VNPALAPRRPKCRVCTLVSSPEDVTIRLFDSDLQHLPIKGAVDYLRAVGIEGTRRQVQTIALSHRLHIDHFLEAGGTVAPAQIADGMTRIPAPIGDAGWIDVNRQGMNVGLTALQIISERMNAGNMADSDLISVAKLGQVAASKRADLEIKGSIKRAESIAKLAAGFAPPEPA